MVVLEFLAATLIVTSTVTSGVLAVEGPFGFGSGTTGGASAAQAIPTSAAELKSWLEDNTPRNILLDRAYDFTDTEGSIDGEGCKSWTCSPSPQLAINTMNWCSASTPKVPITYKKAGTSGIMVGSNKTILGKGTSGWIKGKGLKLQGSNNVIIRNVRISDINPQFVWGGDAISMQGATNVWIDHNYFKSIGRQFIVTHFEPNVNVTISNNYFDGESAYSTGCDNHHYWAFLMLGKDDQMTFARNYGRGPHIGGPANNSQTLHMFNNYFDDITGHALDTGIGAKVLLEGNHFNAVKTPSTGNADGAAFAPISPSMSAKCLEKLGRNCVSNTLTGSGSLTNTEKSEALNSFTADVVKNVSIMDSSEVKAYVLANAGTGKLN
ncbi:Pectin lyase [Ceratobasidium theobromae]|uniref:pectin lyase n=1 Tax=Ceratobasidium theobromae TaxID=1582974 RepID=A0A5N5QG72_9AGAM|nr:Pectin lyase [Ceratobasidium theobromae]